VLDGTIVAGRYVRLAVERHLRDLEGGFHFDDEAADRAVMFIERYCRHFEGEWAGKPFILDGWQLFIVRSIFGWLRDDGLRRFREVYVQVARKVGKSLLAAAIGLYLTIADHEPGAQVYSAATKRDQAKLTHNMAVRMVGASPELKEFVLVRRENISVERSFSKYEPLGGDADTLDGLNVHGAIIDELHAHKDRRVHDVIITATGARRQPVIFKITTAGFDRHSVCWQQRERGIKALERTADDDTLFVFIAEPDEGDDWRDEAIWPKGNPDLAGDPARANTKLDDLRRKARTAAESVQFLNEFLRLCLDMWTEQETCWITLDKWDACNLHPVDVEGLKGRTCYAGMDLSSNTDLTAIAYIFPPEDEDEVYEVLVDLWIPQDGMRIRARRDRVPYEDWHAKGLIYATPGESIDYAFIKAKFMERASFFVVAELAYDRLRAGKLVQEFQEEGVTVAPMGQSAVSMHEPCTELEKLVLGRQINHGGNPALRWMMGNMVVRSDESGNIRPDKKRSRERIDGIVALLMGAGRAIRHADTRSVYETRGVRVY